MRAGTVPAPEYKESIMPRYLVERDFPVGLTIPMNGDGAAVCGKVAAVNLDAGTT
jgi:hypothetical protein